METGSLLTENFIPWNSAVYMETKMLLTIVASYFKYDERYSKQLLLFGLDKK